VDQTLNSTLATVLIICHDVDALAVTHHLVGLRALLIAVAIAIAVAVAVAVTVASRLRTYVPNALEVAETQAVITFATELAGRTTGRHTYVVDALVIREAQTFVALAVELSRRTTRVAIAWVAIAWVAITGVAITWVAITGVTITGVAIAIGTPVRGATPTVVAARGERKRGDQSQGEGKDASKIHNKLECTVLHESHARDKRHVITLSRPCTLVFAISSTKSSARSKRSHCALPGTSISCSCNHAWPGSRVGDDDCFHRLIR
jgi:hypothetical protein